MYHAAALAMSLFGAALAPTADAQEPPAPTVTPADLAPTIPEPSAYRFKGVAPKVRDHRNFGMEFGFRTRLVSIPKTLLDVWYYDAEDDNWAYIERRPRVVGYSLGLEWVLKGGATNGIFWAEYMDSEMKAGYWDDVEEPPDHLDGDFLEPSPGFGIAAFGADYAYEAHLVKLRETQNRFGLSFLIGGGLGLGLMTGKMDRWGPDDDGNPAYKRFLDGESPDENKRLPRVYPIVDVSSALRFNFGDRVVIRVEGGLHSLVFYGASAGVTF